MVMYAGDVFLQGSGGPIPAEKAGIWVSPQLVFSYRPGSVPLCVPRVGNLQLPLFCWRPDPVTSAL